MRFRYNLTIFTFLSLLFWTGFLLNPNHVAKGQATQVISPSVQILHYDIAKYPNISIHFQNRGVDDTGFNSLQLMENGSPIQFEIKYRPTLNVAILADVYDGMPSSELQSMIDAIDGLASSPWKWNTVNKALFMPGEDGRGLSVPLGWDKQYTWRDLANKVGESYHTQPQSSTTALLDLIYLVLNTPDTQFASSTENLNYLLILTNGYNQDSVAHVKDIQNLAIAQGVHIIWGCYSADPNISVAFHTLSSGITGRGNELVLSLKDQTSLIPFWKLIEETDFTSVITYNTFKRPPFQLALQARQSDNLLTSDPVDVVDPIPSVDVSIVKPLTTDILTTTYTNVILKFDWPQLYPERKIARINYSFDHNDIKSIESPSISADGFFTLPVTGASNGISILSIIINESRLGFETTIQKALTFRLPVMPKPQPTTIIITQTPESSILATPASVVNQYLPSSLQIEPPLFLAVWPLIGLSLLLAMGALIGLFRQGKRQRPLLPLPVRPGSTSTDGRTTDSWSEIEKSEPKAEMLLIQGEGALPGVIAIRSPKTIFGRDFNQVDELLASRYVSQRQFIIWEQLGRFVLMNTSVRNETSGEGQNGQNVAIPEANEFPEQGPFLDSGSIISFGPYKYRFIVNQRATEYRVPEGKRSQTAVKANPLRRVPNMAPQL